jgi:hypothetical protein
MSRTHEEVVNTWITYLIEQLVPRITEPPSGRIRLDICYYRSFNMVIESFYDKENVRFTKTLIEVVV